MPAAAASHVAVVQMSLSCSQQAVPSAMESNCMLFSGLACSGRLPEEKLMIHEDTRSAKAAKDVFAPKW